MTVDSTTFFGNSDNSSVENKSLLGKKIDNPTGDTNAKKLLRWCRVIAHILKYTISEFKDMSVEEIENFIPHENEFYVQDMRGEDDEDAKHIVFDLLFQVKGSTDKFSIDIRCDIEPQNKYMRKGESVDSYDLASRGVYYLARMLSRQLASGTSTSSYGQLKKCYSIWLCFDGFRFKNFTPSISDYRMLCDTERSSVTPSQDEEDAADLLELIIIRLGGDSDNELIDFLNVCFRDTDRLTQYIPSNFEGYGEFIKEANNMCDLGEMREQIGEARGETKGKAELAYKFYKMGHDLDETLSFAEISEEDLLEYYPELRDDPNLKKSD